MPDGISYSVSYVPAPTASGVWDDTNAHEVLRRFMPAGRKHPPMIGFIDFQDTRPTPPVLRQIVVDLAEDVRVGRYGNCSLVYCSQDEDTRSVIEDIAESQNIVLFLCSTPKDLRYAEPVGDLTMTDVETLELVLKTGGTVNAQGLAAEARIEKTAAGNRLTSLQKKGYVFRVERPHPSGDLYVDARSLDCMNSKTNTESNVQTITPNRITKEAISAARAGELENFDAIEDVLDELNRNEGQTTDIAEERQDP